MDAGWPKYWSYRALWRTEARSRRLSAKCKHWRSAYSPTRSSTERFRLKCSTSSSLQHERVAEGSLVSAFTIINPLDLIEPVGCSFTFSRQTICSLNKAEYAHNPLVRPLQCAKFSEGPERANLAPRRQPDRPGRRPAHQFPADPQPDGQQGTDDRAVCGVDAGCAEAGPDKKENAGQQGG